MKVQEVMTKSPAYCGPDTNLAAAVEILWRQNCGILPVVDSKETLTGVVTDRDMCVALGTRNQLPSDLRVRDVMTEDVFVCEPGDDVRKALTTMAESKVRRLPVIDAAGKLKGILSIDDIVYRANPETGKKDGHPSAEDLVKALKVIVTPEPPEQRRRAAAA